MWELDHYESWTPKNWCFRTVVLEKALESHLGYKEIQSVHPKGNQSWIFICCWSWNSNTLTIWCEELTHWKRPWCWERLKVGGEGDDREWDGWKASLTRWTWVWVNYGNWWWTERPGVGLVCCSPWSHKESTWLRDWTEYQRGMYLVDLILCIMTNTTPILNVRILLILSNIKRFFKSCLL